MVKQSNYNLFAFVLGREQKIALLELESVLRSFDFYFNKNHPEVSRGINFSILSVVDNVAIIKIKTNNCENRSNSFEEAKSLIQVLGGTMEIYKIIGMAEKIDPDNIYSQISQLSEGHKGRVTFGISDYSNTLTEAKINTLGIDVKKKLRENTSARFVAERGDSHLSSAAIISNRLNKDGILLGIFLSGKQYLIGKLIGVTNPSEWSRRDFGKPKSDKFSGMTPPKLARALINITLSQTQSQISKLKPQTFTSKLQKKDSHCEESSTRQSDNSLAIQQYNNCAVIDPFCGSGNILMEAAMLGCEVIGSDISEKAVENTKANLEWLREQIKNEKLKSKNYGSGTIGLGEAESYKLFMADATKPEFTKELKNLRTEEPKNIVIVTEPYLGNPKKFKPSLNAAKGEYQKVKKLYLDFLKNLQASSCNLQAICIIFPLVETTEAKQYSLFAECVDEIKNLGYTLTCEPMVYGREYQVVKREIVLLKSNSIVTR